METTITKILCKKCGNCDDKRFTFQEQIFKNGAVHIKRKCMECKKGMFVDKKENANRRKQYMYEEPLNRGFLVF